MPWNGGVAGGSSCLPSDLVSRPARSSRATTEVGCELKSPQSTTAGSRALSARPTRRREFCHSAEAPSPSSRCFNVDGWKGGVSRTTELSPAASPTGRGEGGGGGRSVHGLHGLYLRPAIVPIDVEISDHHRLAWPSARVLSFCCTPLALWQAFQQ